MRWGRAWRVVLIAPLIVAVPVNAELASARVDDRGGPHRRVAHVGPSMTRPGIGDEFVRGRYGAQTSAMRADGRTDPPLPPTGPDLGLFIATAFSAIGTGAAIVKRLVRKRNGRSRVSSDAD
jgi:hypothetical protein